MNVRKRDGRKSSLPEIVVDRDTKLREYKTDVVPDFKSIKEMDTVSANKGSVVSKDKRSRLNFYIYFWAIGSRFLISARISISLTLAARYS